MHKYTPTMDQDYERMVIFRFLKNAKNNAIITPSEITNISKLPTKQWLGWAVLKLKADEDKELIKSKDCIKIVFSKRALKKFEDTKEVDWNSLSDSEFKQRFSQLDYESASIIISGQMELFKILEENFSNIFENFKRNQRANIKYLKPQIDKEREEIEYLSAELKTISSRHNIMRELLITK